MARLLVGLPALQGKIEKYKDRYDMVEIRPGDTSVPRPATLRKWRRSVPPAFVFSVVLPRAVGELATGEEADAALAEALEVAAALEARCVLLQTPPEVRPTATNRRKIAALFARIPAEGVVRCWEPSGMWEQDDVTAVARDRLLLRAGAHGLRSEKSGRYRQPEQETHPPHRARPLP
jgi:uncharacterized protein YecE (DUF72 family)